MTGENDLILNKKSLPDKNEFRIISRLIKSPPTLIVVDQFLGSIFFAIQILLRGKLFRRSALLSKKRILKKLQQLTRCAKTMLGERVFALCERERMKE